MDDLILILKHLIIAIILNVLILLVINDNIQISFASEDTAHNWLTPNNFWDNSQLLPENNHD